MTGNKHNPEGNSSDSGEPSPGPYWMRMHRDWKFWVGALLMAAALAIYVLSGDLAWVPHGHPQPAMPAPSANRVSIEKVGRQAMSTTELYPLRFDPIYQYRLWGGRRLGGLLSAPLPGGWAYRLPIRED